VFDTFVIVPTQHEASKTVMSVSQCETSDKKWCRWGRDCARTPRLGYGYDIIIEGSAVCARARHKHDKY
jgi:hypothetical protein